MIEFSRGSSKLIKDINRQIVLNLIHQFGPISGADLAKRTKMRPSTVSIILKTLSDLGLIYTVGSGESTAKGGRKPVLWKIYAPGGYAIGVEVVLKKIMITVLDLESNILLKESKRTNLYSDELELIDEIEHVIKKILSKFSIDPKKVIGVGVGISGLIDTIKGEIMLTSLLRSRYIPLQEMLEDKIGMDIIVENDANAAAFGEHWIGPGKFCQHLIYMEVNEEVTGIGCGLLINGQVYRGANMCAGELGLNLPSITSLYKKDSPAFKDSIILDLVDGKLEKVTTDVLLRAAKQKDSLAIRILEDLGEILGDEIVRMVNLLNPEMVILGGDIADIKNYILEPIRDMIQKKALDVVSKTVRVEISSFENYAVAVGAGCLVLHQVYREPSVDSRYIFDSAFLMEINNLE